MTFRLIRTLAAAVAACAGLSAHAADLTVAAAASLTNAFRDIAPLFEAANPGAKVQFSFGASGALLRQIAKGAPADVLASADQETMDQAQKEGFVKAPQRRDFVSNALVVIVSTSSANPPTAIGDLAQPRYARIAIGLPASVPVGRYTKSVLEAANLWGAIEPKMIGANNVRQALDYVARAEVDAGFVYSTDAALMPDKVKLAFTVPTAQPIRYRSRRWRRPERRRRRQVRRLPLHGAGAVGPRQVRLRQALSSGVHRTMDGAWIALALTLKVAGWATALNLLLGVGVGYALARWHFPGRDLVDAALTLPMVMPPTVLGYYLLVVIGSQGPIGAWLLQHFGIR
jgi:molybdate transport system substrate-binding protein